MKVRKGYVYALLMALGLLLWSNVWEVYQQPQEIMETDIAEMDDTMVPWKSPEVVRECAMKAEEFYLKITSMHVTADTMQGSMDLYGSRENLQNFYSWLEEEGRLRSILAFQMETEDEANSHLSINYQL